MEHIMEQIIALRSKSERHRLVIHASSASHHTIGGIK
jgi:hypothetical protein